MKVVAFAASNSKRSINKTLVTYAANLIDGAQIDILDLNDYEIPLFSEDAEEELGQPDLAKAFLKKMADADAIIVSFAEHNGSYTAAYKNLFDWVSRITREVFQNKPVVFLSTSPGAGGAGNVLAAAVNSGPHFAADIRASLSVPSFHKNFNVEGNTLNAPDIQHKLQRALKLLSA